MRQFGRALALALLAASWYAAAAHAAAQGPTVLATRIEATITPVVADHLVDAVRKAEGDGHAALLVELDTPGGLDTSMRTIIKAFLGARVPVVVYVAPSGARAASAGALITMSAHVAAMAPGTTIGAATPVDLQGGEISDKVINDAAAFAESIAAQRGRNRQFAIDTVRKGRAVPADEALRIDAVDVIAPDRTALLAAVDGREVTLPGPTKTTLRTAGAAVVDFDMGGVRRLLQILADPNLAFLFLSIGTLAVIYELATPGGGFAGAIGAVLLILGFFALSVLPVNVAGLALLALAGALFVAEVFTPGVGVFAGGGSIALVAAGLFLFEGSLFRVSRAVIVPVALTVGGATIVAGRLAWRARRAPPVTGLQTLVGRTVVVRDAEGSKGRAPLDGAWWNVVRDESQPLRDGQRVRVVGVRGLTLAVEPDESPPEEP
jgi:membrane-bound serine protease (ClpP class)